MLRSIFVIVTLSLVRSVLPRPQDMDTGIVRKISLALMVSVSLVYCEPPLSNQYGVPGNYAGGNGHGVQAGNNGYNGNSYNDAHNQDYIDNQPKSYEFGYAVRDAATGNDFGRRETSDGETVRGEYRVQLPDGRTQIVTYTADWRTGFHADVRYEGEAQYPDQYSNNNGYNNNNLGQGYNQGYSGNNGGFNNNYRPGGGGNYNGGGSNYNYQLGSNAIDNYNNFGTRNSYNTGTPSPTYGPAFH